MSAGFTPTAVLASTVRAMRNGRRAMVGYGQFVMYSEAQIRQAVGDLNSRRFTWVADDRGLQTASSAINPNY